MTASEGVSILDCHLHLWNPERLKYPWLNEAPALNRAFTADEFAAVRPAPVEAVFMEAGRDERQIRPCSDSVRTRGVRARGVRGRGRSDPDAETGRTGGCGRGGGRRSL